jgi:hypothetical protein
MQKLTNKRLKTRLRVAKHRARKRRASLRESLIEDFNELAERRLSREQMDRFEASGILPAVFRAELEALEREQLLEWQATTGERLPWLNRAELLALQASRHDRARRDYKPNKSPDHDIPWSGAVNWAPRRWFGPCPSGKPQQMSIARAREGVHHDYDLDRMLLATEIGQEDSRNTTYQLLSERNHPNPGGFWEPERGYWGPVTAPIKQRVVYRREIDEQPPESVLRQKHEPPGEPGPPPIVGVFRQGRPPAWINSFYDLRGIIPGNWSPNRQPKVARAIGYQRPYWDHHIIALAAGERWTTKPQRRTADAPYTIDLIWREVDIGPTSAGVHHAPQPFSPWICHVVDCPSLDEYPRRTLAGEILRSPFFPRGFEKLFRQRGDAIGWAANNPDRRPGTWAQRHVEAPANVLTAKREERRRRAAE